MTTHGLKIQEQYADAVLNGTKTFEIRKNDRGYKIGDEIVFDVVTNEGYAVGAAARHPLNGATYRIDNHVPLKQLARAAGVNLSSLSHAIRGGREVKMNLLLNLAEAMGEDPRDIARKKVER